MMPPRRVTFLVRGRVQGVAYRASAERAAREIPVTGWVRNRDDGAVEGEAQGTGAAVERFLAWCKIGPAGAHVTDVSVTELVPDAAEHAFRIRG